MMIALIPATYFSRSLVPALMAARLWRFYFRNSKRTCAESSVAILGQVVLAVPSSGWPGLALFFPRANCPSSQIFRKAIDLWAGIIPVRRQDQRFYLAISGSPVPHHQG